MRFSSKVLVFLVPLILVLVGVYAYNLSGSAQDVRPAFVCDEKQINQPGCFDYHIYNQFWLPEICISDASEGFNRSNAACETLFEGFKPTLAVHGLWQNYLPNTHGDVDYPTFCTEEKLDFEALPIDVRKGLNAAYSPVVGGMDLINHEWSKHGTCEGVSQEAYFRKVLGFNSMLADDFPWIEKFVGQSIAYDKLVALYADKGYTAQFFCNKYDDGYYLSNVQTYWARDGKPFEASEQSNHLCQVGKPIKIRATAPFMTAKNWLKIFNKKHPKPITVGFDIDDTIFFSSPGFYYLNKVLGLKANDPKFWNLMNSSVNGSIPLDNYSLPKPEVAYLLDAHKKRGDTIVFITKRKNFTPSEQVTRIVQKTFQIKNMSPVIFTNGKDKTPYVKDEGIELYYGDADADITSSIAASAQGIRIRRSPSSRNLSKVYPGAFGEVVILDTER